MSEFSVFEKLPNNTLSFLKDNIFCDVELKNGKEKMNSHKLILIKESSWFKAFFKKNPSTKQVNIAYDPDKVLFKLIESLYSGKLEISPSTFASYLNIAHFYGMKALKEAISKYINKIVTKKTLLNISKQLCHYHLDNEASKYANDLYDIYNKLDSKMSFYKCVSPIVFSNVLKKVKERFYLKKNDDNINETMFSIIEDFVNKTNCVRNEDDKKALASIIEWDSKSYLFLIKYEASWVPASISRSMYSKILSLRRKSVNGMTEEVKKVTKSTNKWYPISWFTSIAKSTGSEKSVPINVIELFSTVGEAKNFNPATYELVDVTGSKSVAYGTVAEHTFSVKNIFSSDNKHYLSKEGCSSNKPYVTVCFGTKIEMSSLTVFSDSPYEVKDNDDMKVVRHFQTPKKLIVDVGINSEPKTNAGSIEFNKGAGTITFNKPVECKSIKLTMDGSSTAEWWNLRIAKLELIGRILPN